ncbi:MAG: orotidine 5'-phosphate decarboxylase / HUMPS family protein [Synechococcales bacterium]|nr:orotidine 5'-phosphate decarboxylase / HUMPS family protein [Synechococcales bacterium]
MQLQISVDLLSLDQALSVLQSVAPFVDIIEAGAVLIKQQGIETVSVFKKAFPEKLISAHMKTVCHGGLEANMAFQAGADFTTVLAVASNSTIAGALSSARKHNRTIVADMRLVPNLKKRAKELEEMGVTHLMLNCNLEDDFRSLTAETIKSLASLRQSTSATLMAAGAINYHVIPQLKTLGVDIAVFGAVIYASSSAREVARQIRQVTNQVSTATDLRQDNAAFNGG